MVDVALLCGLCCMLSMIFTHGAGNYIFTLFDDFSGNVPLLIIAFFECIAVSYFYGLNRLVVSFYVAFLFICISIFLMTDFFF